jgi:hypothetical protein
MIKKKERPIKYTISCIVLLIFTFASFIGGIFILTYLISYPNIFGIIGLLGCFYASFICLINALSYIQISWAMRLTLNPFFRIGYLS